MNIICTICQGNITCNYTIYATVCGHVFHCACLDQWRRRSATCPQCRRRIVQGDYGRMYLQFSNDDNSAVTDERISVAINRGVIDNLKAQLLQSRQHVAENLIEILRCRGMIEEKCKLVNARNTTVKDLQYLLNCAKKENTKLTADKKNLESQLEKAKQECENVKKSATSTSKNIKTDSTTCDDNKRIDVGSASSSGSCRMNLRSNHKPASARENISKAENNVKKRNDENAENRPNRNTTEGKNKNKDKNKQPEQVTSRAPLGALEQNSRVVSSTEHSYNLRRRF